MSSPSRGPVHLTGFPYEEEKVWGRVQHIFASPSAAVSVLEVKAGYQCSVHKHEFRENMFAVLSGRVAVEYADSADSIIHNWSNSKRSDLGRGDVFTIPAGLWHRFIVLENGRMVEVYWTIDETDVHFVDIVRANIGGPVDQTPDQKKASEPYAGSV